MSATEAQRLAALAKKWRTEADAQRALDIGGGEDVAYANGLCDCARALEHELALLARGVSVNGDEVLALARAAIVEWRKPVDEIDPIVFDRLEQALKRASAPRAPEGPRCQDCGALANDDGKNGCHCGV
jgi:hypothetical protein